MRLRGESFGGTFRSPHLGRLVFGLLLGLVGVDRANAAPKVVIFGAEDISTGLQAAIHIQLAGRAEILERPVMIAPSYALRALYVHRALEQADAVLGIWVDTATSTKDQTSSVLRMAGHEGGTWQMVSLSLLPPLTPDRERALALKISEQFDAWRRVPQVQVPPPRPRRTVPPVKARWRIQMDTGGQTTLSGAGSIFGWHVGLSWARTTSQTRWEARIAGAWHPPRTDQAFPGQIETQTWWGALGGSGLFKFGPIWGGGAAFFRGHALRAVGTTLGGTIGRQTLWSPAVFVGGDVRWPFFNGLEIRGRLGPEFTLIKRHLALNDTVVTRLPVVSGVADISLIVTVY